MSSLPAITEKDIDRYLFGSGCRLTESQKVMFVEIAKAFGLNPFKREIHCIVFGNQFSIVVGYETYLKRAEATGLLEYWEAGVRKDNGELVGYCTIKRKDWSKPFTIEAWYSEYKRDTAIWREKPRTMIRKVAIAQAFRMAFPSELGGMPYAPEELGDQVQTAEIITMQDQPPVPEIPGLPTEEQSQALEFLAEAAAKAKKPVEKLLAEIQADETKRDKFLAAYRKKYPMPELEPVEPELLHPTKESILALAAQKGMTEADVLEAFGLASLDGLKPETLEKIAADLAAY